MLKAADARAKELIANSEEIKMLEAAKQAALAEAAAEKAKELELQKQLAAQEAAQKDAEYKVDDAIEMLKQPDVHAIVVTRVINLI